MKVKIAHCGDIHLGFRNLNIGSKASDVIHEEIKNSIKNILKFCKDDDVEFLLIAGDLFDDTNIPENEVKWLIDEIKKYDSYKIIISPGNHDPYTTDSPYRNYEWPSNVMIFKSSDIKKIEFKEKNLIIWGSAFTSRYKQNSIFKQIKVENDDNINICVMHGNVQATGENEYNPIYLSDIKSSNLDYLALGHIHKRSDIIKLGKTYYSYCGTPQAISFNELGDRGIYVGYVEKNFCDIKFEKIGKRNFEVVEVDISECNYVDEVSEKILSILNEKFGDGFSKNAYEIKLTGNVSEDFFISESTICSKLEEEVFYAKIIDGTEVRIDEEKLKFRNDFKGMFIKSMIEKIKESEDEEEKELNKLALKIGLKSFEREVKYIDN